MQYEYRLQKRVTLAEGRLFSCKHKVGTSAIHDATSSPKSRVELKSPPPPPPPPVSLKRF